MTATTDPATGPASGPTADASEVAYLIDTSVLLRAAIDGSAAAARWFDERLARDAFLVGSRWLATEALRVVVNREVRGEQIDRETVEAYLDAVDLLTLDDDIADRAARIRADLRGGDALHVATAQRLATDGGTVVVVTHDQKMATAARDLGYPVTDPVTDDPHRPPVA